MLIYCGSPALYQPPYTLSPDITDRSELSTLVSDLLQNLAAAEAEVQVAEEIERRLADAATQADIIVPSRYFSALSGAGGARHVRRRVGLALAALAEACDTSWAEQSSDEDIRASVAMTLMAYRIGTGGGYVDPGEGTTRAVDPDLLTSPDDDDTGWDVWLRRLHVPYGGGFRRRYATGGDAWSAAALEAAHLVHEPTASAFGFHSMMVMYTGHPRGYLWYPAAEPVMIRELATLRDQIRDSIRKGTHA
jgi:hypothetical protein